MNSQCSSCSQNRDNEQKPREFCYSEVLNFVFFFSSSHSLLSISLLNTSCVNFAIWILFLCFPFFSLHLLGFVFNLFFTFPTARPHSIDSQAAIDKTATYFRAHRTFFHLPITISLLGYTSHIFHVSSFASLRSPSFALSLCIHPLSPASVTAWLCQPTSTQHKP